MAAPHVAGVAALAWEANPTLNNTQLAQVLEASATDLGPGGWDATYGWGLVNASAAVQLAEAQG
jgi:subtilisin family serine protease